MTHASVHGLKRCTGDGCRVLRWYTLQHIKQFLDLHKYCKGHEVKLPKDTATADTTKHAVSKISHFVTYVTCYTFKAFRLLVS
jgi:hypothetical protein